MAKKVTSTDKDTNLLDLQLKIKGVGKLSITFDARSRVEKMFSNIVDKFVSQAESELKEKL